MKNLLQTTLLLLAIFTNTALKGQQTPFVTVWDTGKPGSNSNTAIALNVTGTNFSIEWEEVSNPSNNGSVPSANAPYVLTVPSSGIYRVKVVAGTGSLTAIGHVGYDAQRLIRVEQWGNNKWSVLHYAFAGAVNMDITATDAPNLSKVKDLSYMFRDCRSLQYNSSINTWDVSSIENMVSMFQGTRVFNQDLNNWNTANVTNMYMMFYDAQAFNGRVDGWNTGKVTNMAYMFCNTKVFNQDMNSWNTGSVTNMQSMFQGATAFNGQIGNWDVSNVANMQSMFWNAYEFNQPIGSWNPQRVTTMNQMFMSARKFNQDLTNWNTGSVTNMGLMFYDAKAFNGRVDNWQTGNVTDMSLMFCVAEAFNQNMNNWNTGNVKNMQSMFQGATAFNGQIGNWDVSNVANMQSMFWNAYEFNQPIGSWNPQRVTTMNQMFMSARKFNQDLTNWDTGSVTNMSHMFYDAKAFNGRVDNWQTGNVTNMSQMFCAAEAFNQNMNNWDTGNVTNMQQMFYRAKAFNGEIGNWNVQKVINMYGMFMDAPAFNKPIGNWVPKSVTDMSYMFCRAKAFNQDLTNWDTGSVTNMGLMFYDAKAFNGRVDNWQTGNVTNMSQMFCAAEAFNQNMNNWDTGNVTNMIQMFHRAKAFNGEIGNWNVQKVTNMYGMFMDAPAFNKPMGNWVPKSVTDMSYMFCRAKTFNQDLADWNTGSVVNMSLMFYEAEKFNGSVENWQTGNVKNMSHMFCFARAFNQNMNKWNTANVTDMSKMFYNANSFNGEIGNWNVENVTTMNSMFTDAYAFDKSLGSWRTINVKDMYFMFGRARTFNQDLTNWETGNVTNMGLMFYEAEKFNGEVTNWNTSNVTNMNDMFVRAASFNQDVSKWNTENVVDMHNMFHSAKAFNHDLGSWNLKSVKKFGHMLTYTGMDCANYSATLRGWADNINTPDSVSIGAHDRRYNRDALEARSKLVDIKGWKIEGDKYVTACGGLNNIWIGANSTNWGDPGNWLGNQTPPSAADADIEFATVDNNNGVAVQNNLKLDYSRQVGKFVNNTDKALIIPAGMSLTVNGTLLGSETPEKVNNIQILASDRIANGALILAGQPTDTPVYGMVQMYSKAHKGNERTWTDNIEGSPTKGKTFKSGYRWQHFGIPVESILADTTFYGAFIREYDETYNGDNTTFFNKWRKVHNGTTLTAFKGYEITRANPTYYTIKGKFMFGDKQLTMTRKAPLVTGATNPDTKINHWGLGQNIFGNSYTASININKIEFPSEVEATVYIYNTGSFADWANTGSNSTTTQTHNIPGAYLAIPQNLATVIWSNRIPSMQGFLLKFKNEETIFNKPDAVVTLKYDTEGVLPNTQPQKIAAPDTANYLGYLQITLSGEQSNDVMWLVETPQATDKFDNGYDGHKLISTISSASLFADIDGNPLQISSSRSVVGDVFSFRSNGAGTYSLNLVKSGLDRYANLYLLDLVAKKYVPLANDTTTYQFTSDNTNKIEKRFMITDTFDTTTDIENNPNVELLDAYMSHNNKTLIVNNMTSSAGSISILDVSGRAIAYSNINVGFSQIPVNLHAGVYMVLIKASDRVKNIKVVVK